jgi:hypothetical protein
MVTVAKGLNAPIKLMFPRAGVANATNPDAPIKMQVGRERASERARERERER